MPFSDTPVYSRHRKQVKSTHGARSRSYTFDTPSAWNTVGVVNQVTETWDKKNPWREWNGFIHAQSDKAYRKRLRMADIGGPFYLKREIVDVMSDGYEYDLAHTTPAHPRYYGYQGPLFAKYVTETAIRGGPWAAAYECSSEPSLDAYGSTAISRCAPTVPHAQVFQAIGELYRDGVPLVPGSTTVNHADYGHLGNPGDEYLNIEFGIVPLVSDLRKLNGALLNADRILKQYYRDSGRLVRRRYSFPVERTLKSRTVTNNVLPQGGTGADNSYLWLNTGQLETTVTEVTFRWFSGAFTYYAGRPEKALAGIASQLRGYNHLLGLAPDESAFYNLTPYSWLADWKTNMGDIMLNLSMYQNDGLVMRWGYVMEHKQLITEYHCTGARAKFYGGGSGLITASQRFVQETKRRRPATPFGFGVDGSSLNGRQLAILAALGFTHNAGLGY